MERQESGFTLVELAIVLIIIGLLIGGVLKGQAMIENSHVLATIAQIKSIDAAINTFEDTYNAMPGDMANAAARLPNCTAYPCNNNGADGDGMIYDELLYISPIDETNAFFPDLSAANLLSGINLNGGQTYGGWYAAAAVGIGSGYYPSTAGGSDYYPEGSFSQLIGPDNTAFGLYLAFANNFNAPPATSLTPHEAAQIDTKLDDGNPASGFIRGFGSTGTGVGDCGTPTAYNESASRPNCGLYIQMRR